MTEENVIVTKVSKCPHGKHTDQPVNGRTKRLKCTVCSEEFPCRHDCIHYDCIEARTGPWECFPDSDPWLKKKVEDGV